MHFSDPAAEGVRICTAAAEIGKVYCVGALRWIVIEALPLPEGH